MVLRVALPERGDSAARAVELVERAGFSIITGPRDPQRWPVHFFRLPERDVAVYTNHGVLDLALTGSLAIAEASIEARGVVALDTPSHELTLLAARDRAASPQDLAGCRVATPYPHLVRRYFAVRGIGVDRVVALDPAEQAVTLGIADAIAVVIPLSRAAGSPATDLCPIDVLGNGGLVAVENRAPASESIRSARHRFLARLRAARLADTVVLLQFDCQTSAVESVLEDISAVRTPEVCGLTGTDLSVVRLLVPVEHSAEALDGLRARGCAEILAFPPGMYEPGDDHADGENTPTLEPTGSGMGVLPQPRAARWPA